MTHTPGPWKIELTGNENCVGYLEMKSIPGVTRKIATIAFSDRESFNTANARLIASAPLMLAVLNHTKARLEAKGIKGSWVDEINEAIAKAEGK